MGINSYVTYSVTCTLGLFPLWLIGVDFGCMGVALAKLVPVSMSSPYSYLAKS